MCKHVTWACDRQPPPSPLFQYNRMTNIECAGCNLSNKHNTDGLWKFELFKLEVADTEKFYKFCCTKLPLSKKLASTVHSKTSWPSELQTMFVDCHAKVLHCTHSTMWPTFLLMSVGTSTWFWWPLYCRLHYKPLAQKLYMVKHSELLILINH